jgi:hypothetical protein
VSGVVYIPNEAPRPKLPRKKKKKFIKWNGPNAYKQYLAGVPLAFITSDYVSINGVIFAPWNRKETRKFKWDKLKSRYSKKTINPKYYGVVKVDEL